MGPYTHQFAGMCIYLALGAIGGLLGLRLKITGAPIIGAMIAVLAFRMVAAKPYPIPKGFSLIVQILIGVVIGVSYTPEMGKMLTKILLPVIASTLILVGAGFLISLVLVKTGMLDAPTAYLGTSPGAMSALIVFAEEVKANSPVVLAFHFFRVVFIVLTAPLAFYLIRLWSQK